MRKRLKDTDAVYIKVAKLIDFANELGITLRVQANGCLEVVDKERGSIQMVDVEGMDDPCEFPPAFEFKLVVED